MGGEPLALNALWAAAALPDALRFAAATRRVRETQERLLHRVLRRGAATSFGRRHRLALVKTVAEFREAVPVRSWEELGPDLEAVRRGERDRLFPGPAERLVPTSGSTASAKLVPFTAELRRELLRGINPWVSSLYRRFPRTLRGRSYWSISPPMADLPAPLPGGPPVGFGDDGEYLGPLSRLALERLRSVPAAVAGAPGGEAFRYTTALFLLADAHLALLSVWHPSFLGVILDAVPAWADRLRTDLRAGTLRPPGGIDEPLRRALERRLRPDARRAAALRPLLAADPVPWPRVWPRLAHLSCWKDAAAATAAAALAERFPGVPIEGKGLLATEGIVSFPWLDGEPPALAVTSHFFEFVAREPDGPDAGPPLLADEVAAGRTYAVLLTTGGGLWRYRGGDLVRVEGFCGACPLLRFVGREGAVSDLAGEKLHEAHAGRALAAAAARLGSRPRFSLLAPEAGAPGAPPGYAWFVEVDDPAGAPWREAVTVLEAALAESPHYRHARRMGQLAPVRVFRVARGAAAAHLAAQVAAGRRAGDVKPAALERDSGWSRRFEGSFIAEA